MKNIFKILIVVFFSGIAFQVSALSLVSVINEEDFIFGTKTVRIGDRDCYGYEAGCSNGVVGTNNVAKIQEALGRCYQEPLYKPELGWGNKIIKADGKFGPMTKKVVVEFQNGYGLVPDGIVGLKTREKLFEVCTKISPNFYQYQGRNQ